MDFFVWKRSISEDKLSLYNDLAKSEQIVLSWAIDLVKSCTVDAEKWEV